MLRYFEDDAEIHFTKVYLQATTRNVLTLQQIDGVPLSYVDLEQIKPAIRTKIVANATKAVFKQCLTYGFFHADPHPGNIFVLPGEVVGIMDFGTVGNLDPNDRAALVRLYVTAVRMDAVSLVEQLIQIGIADPGLDRTLLQRDVRRLLLKYQGMPLQDIRMGELLEPLRPIIYRHHLRLPSNFWLLAKTLVMMEGVGLELDPDFDIFEVSEPYVRRFLLRMWLPTSWGPSLTHSATGWADLLNSLPRQTTRILGQVERGELEVQFGLPHFERYFDRVDKITTRIVLSVLLAAIILGLAQHIPNIDLAWPWSLFTWILVTGFVVMLFLGAWLVLSILRSGGKL